MRPSATSPADLIRTGAVGSRRGSSSVCRFGGESKQTHRREEEGVVQPRGLEAPHGPLDGKAGSGVTKSGFVNLKPDSALPPPLFLDVFGSHIPAAPHPSVLAGLTAPQHSPYLELHICRHGNRVPERLAACQSDPSQQARLPERLRSSRGQRFQTWKTG